MRNKFLKGVTSLGVAAAICMAFGAVSASAATIDTSNIEINYETQKIIITPNGKTVTEDPAQPDASEEATDASEEATDASEEASEDEEADAEALADEEETASDATVASDAAEPASGESGQKTEEQQILFGVSTVNAKKGTLKTAAWEVYDVVDGEVVIDISSLNTQVDNYVQIKGSQYSEPITLHIKPTSKKLKMKFDAVTGKVIDNKSDSAVAGAALEYRTQYGDWEEYGTFATGKDLKVYQQRGATLYFRQQTTEELNWDKDTTTLVDITEDAKNTAKITEYYEVPALPGKEIKVAVGKKANGPKATVDYLKNTVKLPKGVVWRVNTADGLGTYTTTATSDAKGFVDDANLAKLLKGATLELKTAATDKKAESKVTQVSVKPQAKLPVATGSLADNTTSAKVGDLTAKISEEKNKKGEVTGYTLELTNGSSDKTVKYEVVVGDDKSEAPAVVNTSKKTAVASGKTVKVKKVVAGSKVYVHQVGVKNVAWATEYVQLGIVAGEAENVDQKNLQALADELIGATATADLTTDNLTIDFLNGKTVKWEKADYTLSDSDSTEVKDVTATASIPADTENFTLEDGVLTYAGSLDDLVAGPGKVTVTVTFTKDGCTDVEKTIDVTVTATVYAQLKTLIDDLVPGDTTCTVERTAVAVKFLGDGKNVSWYTEADYPLNDDTVTGVTASISIDDETNFYLYPSASDMQDASTTDPVEVASYNSFTSGTVVNITVTLTKDGETVEKTIAVTVEK